METMSPSTTRPEKTWEASWTEQLERNNDFESTDLMDLAISEIHQARKRARIGAGKASEVQSIPVYPGTAEETTVSMDHPQVSDAVIDKLFNIYWCLIGLHWPLFSRKKYPTLHSLRHMAETKHPLLFHAICAISARVWENEVDGGVLISDEPDSFTARQLSTIFAVRAHCQQISACTESTLENVAAFVMLTLFESGSGRSAHAAHFCWTACRMVTDLGLLRPGEMGKRRGYALTPVEDDARRRVYWCTYILDKNIAAQLGRPPVLRDVESDCPMPFFDREEEHATWAQLRLPFPPSLTVEKLKLKQLSVSSFLIHGCRLALIAEQIIAMYTVAKGKRSRCRDLGNTVEDIHHQLEEWIANTPEQLQWKPNTNVPTFPYILHQQIWSQACKILLHRPYILRPCSSSFSSHTEASMAADNIIAMFVDYEANFPLRRVSSSTVYCLFNAATISLGNLTSMDAIVVNRAKAQLRSLVRWFTSISETWSSALQHLAILEKLAVSMKVDLSETGIQTASQATKASKHVGLPTNAPLGIGTQSPFSHSVSSDESTSNARRESSGASLPAVFHDVPNDEQAIEEFWPDMPLGEDFDKWSSFTQTYLSVLGNAAAPTSSLGMHSTNTSEQGDHTNDQRHFHSRTSSPAPNDQSSSEHQKRRIAVSMT